jgi:hypothetical protein
MVRMSGSVRLVSELSKHFPICMPDLHSIQYKYIKEYLGSTEPIDLLFPDHKVKAYKRCHELIVAPKKSWGYRPVGGTEKKEEETSMDIEVPNIDVEL